MQKIKYGWIKDKEDKRDFMYRAVAPTLTIPEKVDLSADFSEIENQEDLGSCTANALAGNLEFLDKVVDGKSIDVSRLFIYYNERKEEGTINEDSGAMLRDGIKTLARYGSCSEKRIPYVVANFKKKPSCIAYREATKHKITSYHRIETLQEMLNCLAEGFPFVFGFMVYSGMEAPEVAKTGVLNMPKPGEYECGGHAVCAVGYDQSQKRFLVRNSWGKEWGMQGYFTMPYEYMTQLADDFWTIRKVNPQTEED